MQQDERGPPRRARIGLLTASASRRGGGVAEAVAAQAAMIRSLGHDAVVLALADGLEDEARASLGPTPVEFSRVRGPRAIGFAPSLAGKLAEAELDVLHLHGIWMYPSRAALRWRTKTGRPLVISPHGMLDPWITARGRAKKALARAGYERASWRAASAFHALTATEARDIARESGRIDPPMVIPNPAPRAAPVRTDPPPPHLLYLGRIHPKKNLDGLLAGWRDARKVSGARLTIAGWGDDAHVAALRQALAAARDPSVRFVGPAYGEAKQRLLEDARFVILPSHSEGLPMVVLEAWASAIPALISEGCNLPEGFAANAALRCGTSAGEIARVIERALDLDPASWRAMASAARDLAAGPFSAETVAARWDEAYAALLVGDRG